MNQVLEATDLAQHYPVGGGMFAPHETLKAVDGVTFDLEPGKTLAVVGESGCGKSTLGRVCTLIEPPTSGTLKLDGRPVDARKKSDVKAFRSFVQMIFQNPYGSLNPRQKVGAILEEPLLINTSMPAAERRERAAGMLAKVGLRPEHYARYPHMFSGGQRQRIAIARALMLEPKIVVADEPVSALDISIQAQVLNLLMDLQEEFGLAYVFISHDLSVVRHLADEVMVMYLGRAVEQGPSAQIFADPAHPYTQALLAATPAVDPKLRQERVVLTGELPSPLNPPPGCHFHRRCRYARPDCSERTPHLRPVRGREVACHYAEDLGSPRNAAA
jgi:dipeptide transport system ATP-binding protein